MYSGPTTEGWISVGSPACPRASKARESSPAEVVTPSTAAASPSVRHTSLPVALHKAASSTGSPGSCPPPGPQIQQRNKRRKEIPALVSMPQLLLNKSSHCPRKANVPPACQAGSLFGLTVVQCRAAVLFQRALQSVVFARICTTQQLTCKGHAAELTSHASSLPVVGIFSVLNGARPLVSGE